MQDLGLMIDNRSIVANSVRTASVDILDIFSNFAVVSSYCSADLLSFAIHCSLSLLIFSQFDKNEVWLYDYCKNRFQRERERYVS